MLRLRVSRVYKVPQAQTDRTALRVIRVTPAKPERRVLPVLPVRTALRVIRVIPVKQERRVLQVQQDLRVLPEQTERMPPLPRS